MCLGIPGRVSEIVDAQNWLATVVIGGVAREVSLACIVDVDHPVESCVGDWVLVHAGFAMSRLDEAEALRTLELLERVGELQEELAQMRASGDAL